MGRTMGGFVILTNISNTLSKLPLGLVIACILDMGLLSNPVIRGRASLLSQQPDAK